MNNPDFKSLPLKLELLNNLHILGYHNMTPIQEQSLPVILDGGDVIAKAQTGTGKTAAFGLGVLNKLNLNNTKIQALILCPTRELAEQVAEEIRRLARQLSNVKVLTICGGLAEFHQEKSLSYGAHIVVGTPGRVLRLLQKRSLRLGSIETLVLDEADRMLEMGFYESLLEIGHFLPNKKQSLLFSATFPESIEELSRNFQKNATRVTVDQQQTPAQIHQIFYQVKSHEEKNEALIKVLGKFQPSRAIVFCKTKQLTEMVASFLNSKNIKAKALHGDLEQNDRVAILTQFSNQSLSILVATDVAARGLDIQQLPVVINYDLPGDPHVYIHRVGRTGRAQEQGVALSFYIAKNQYKLDGIAELTGKKLEVEKLSSIDPTIEYKHQPPMKTIYISGGKRDKLRPGDLLGALVKEARLDPNAIGEIKILNILSYVAIDRNRVDQAVAKLSQGKIKKKKFKVGLV